MELLIFSLSFFLVGSGSALLIFSLYLIKSKKRKKKVINRGRHSAGNSPVYKKWMDNWVKEISYLGMKLYAVYHPEYVYPVYVTSIEHQAYEYLKERV